jgi:hypothetical protein
VPKLHTFRGDTIDSPSAPVGRWVRKRILKYQGGGSAYHPHNIHGASHGVGTSTTAEIPHWYYYLERYVRYGVDQAQCAVEGIGRVKCMWDEFEHVQTEMHASIDSQTNMVHSILDHFGIDPDA